jgi:hypothetical protein
MIADKTPKPAGGQGAGATEFDQALSDLAKAAVPLVQKVIEVLHTNLDPVSAASKDLLTTASKHVEPLLTAGAQMVSSGARGIQSTLGNLSFGGSTQPSTGTGGKDQTVGTPPAGRAAGTPPAGRAAGTPPRLPRKP